MRILVWVGVVATVACGSTGPDEVRTGPDEVRSLARLYEEQPVVVVPDTVSVSTPFNVSIETLGGGCTREDETEVEVVGNTATISPYVHFPVGSGFGCTGDVLRFVQGATVTFAAVGEGTIVFRVREYHYPWAPVEFHYLVWVE